MKTLFVKSIGPMTIFSGLMLISAGTAHADEWHAQVRTKLDVAVKILGDLGYAPHGKYHIDDMKNDQTDEQSVLLEAGVDYMIIGACDEDCSDIDMSLLDSDDFEIDADEDDDNAPVLFVRPEATGKYMVVTEMYDCEAEPCSFGYTILKE